ncbi:hypothetical protein [Streptomyces sp. SudanB91_2054]|uniref:hypothetical protein n=1 Tax=Streptomyces sp. SudanB91_2054 TaxID=3035278 RepID=UPI0036DD99BD
MRFRGLLLGLFLLPAVVGAYLLAGSATEDGTPRCDGIIEEYGDAERSGPMKPGETCDLYDFADGRSQGTRSYEQQRKAQETKASKHGLVGGVCLVYGLAGACAVIAGRRAAPAPPGKPTPP